MATKIYKAVFNRYNPQLPKAYEIRHRFEAANKREARKECKRFENTCVYGSLSLVSLEEEA